MSEYINAEIDLTAVATIEEFHKRIRQGMTLPEWYGDNLDALHDVFGETQGQITVKGSEAVDQDMNDYVDKFRAMCLDAQRENPLLKITVA